MVHIGQEDADIMNASSAQLLHDRATRGEELTVEEQVELDQWYADQDDAEATLLHVSSSTYENSKLKGQVHETLEQLRVITERIQALSDENDAIHQEIADLQQRIVYRPTSHAA